jgi:N-acetylmuramic acid 6-phosphate etherase
VTGGPDALAYPPTEERNPHTVMIDRLSTFEVLHLINAEDVKVPMAVGKVLPQLAEAVDLVVATLGAGHRLHYFGAGTSGRLAVLDAAELRPTFGIEQDCVVAHLAGGMDALTNPSEAAEDDEAAGAATASEAVRQGDVAVGLSASGRTPYVAGALRIARANGAGTVLISANPSSATLAPLADVHVAVDTGPEVVTGSTRMKAGTAQKLVLNALSTAVMIRLGRTYANFMTDMIASNDKLRNRQIRMLAQATGADMDACRTALAQADGNAKVALVTLLSPVTADQAEQALQNANGLVHEALRVLQTPMAQ